MKTLSLLTALALCSGAAMAKLPAPSDEAKAKAAEAAAKAAHGNKVAAYQLCKSQDRVAAMYRADLKKAGKPVPPAADTGACADPGAYVPAPVVAANSAKPMEAAGAHSPAATAVKPPVEMQPAAASAKKK